MSGQVFVIGHPLVQHKLTLMRSKDTSTSNFRDLLREISMLLAYEVTRDLPMEMIEVETPLAKTMQPTISGKKLVFAPILRADSLPGSDSRSSIRPSSRGSSPRTFRVASWYTVIAAVPAAPARKPRTTE